MPPFYAAGPIGYYQDDGRLTEEEIKVISKWVDDGAPRGRASTQPRESRWSDDGGTEKPDLQLKIQTPYKVKKDGPDDYEYFAFDYVFPQDTWIRGVDVLPSNRSAVHHVVVYNLPDQVIAGADGRIEGANPLMGATVVLFWNSGGLPLRLPPKSALVIPKGSRLGLEVHYAPTTLDGVVDQPSVGIYYANGVVDKLVHSQYGITRNIEIPAGQKSYQLVVYKKFTTDALIVSFGAHMHLRGKSFTIRMIYPDGKKETVFELPRFYFYWQRSYILAKPLAVPSGTVAEYTAEWDNSAGNPYNPDPGRAVRFGLGTNDEMMGGRITYLIPDEELRSNIKDGVKVATPAANPRRSPMARLAEHQDCLCNRGTLSQGTGPNVRLDTLDIR